MICLDWIYLQLFKRPPPLNTSVVEGGLAHLVER